jgi:hypothetical protein
MMSMRIEQRKVIWEWRGGKMPFTECARPWETEDDRAK